MPSVPYPIRGYYRAQADITWLGLESESALGAKSNMGSIIARLEGGGGARRGSDLLEDPMTALAEVVERSEFRAAGRIKQVQGRFRLCAPRTRELLRAVYWCRTTPCLEAWDLLANVVPFSPLAQRRHRESRVRVGLMEWLLRLSSRKTGAPGPDRRRSKPRATPEELSLISSIDRECREILLLALQEYSGDLDA